MLENFSHQIHAVGNCFFKLECFNFLIENIRDLVSIKTNTTWQEDVKVLVLRLSTHKIWC